MHHTKTRALGALLACSSLVGASLLGACASHSAARAPLSPTTRAQQQAMTPDEALARLQDGNARFRAGAPVHRDLPADVRASGGGQYPFAVVLSCIDSRSAPEIVFDQGIGDLFVPRIAGNYVQADLLGSMEFATKVAGAKLVLVLGHTSCGAIKGACDDVQLGNLTTVIQALRPAVTDVPGFAGERTSHDDAFVLAVTEANVRRTVARIRADSPIMRDLEQGGQLRIVGAMYDVSTGTVRLLD